MQAGVELAREGGPQAIVLREAARRVGVSPNAAYRHFTALPELVEAVARQALTGLAEAMIAELARCRPSGDKRQDAWSDMRAVGRGYIHFALREPGLFECAFDQKEGLDSSLRDKDPDALSPDQLLTRALTGLVSAGLLASDKIDAAGTTAWATVHGLSLLLLGPMSGLRKAERERIVEATLSQIGEGLLSRR